MTQNNVNDHVLISCILNVSQPHNEPL